MLEVISNAVSVMMGIIGIVYLIKAYTQYGKDDVQAATFSAALASCAFAAAYM